MNEKMTLGDLIKEASVFEFSKDYFDIMKEAGEVQLMELCLESYEYMAECVDYDIPIHESVVAMFDDTIFTEASIKDKATEFANSVKDKAGKFVQNARETGSKISNIAHEYFSRAIGLLEKIFSFVVRPFNAVGTMISTFINKFSHSSKRTVAMEALKKIENVTPSKEFGKKWIEVVANIRKNHDEYNVALGFFAKMKQRMKNTFSGEGLGKAWGVVNSSMKMAKASDDDIAVIRSIFNSCASDSFYLPPAALLLIGRSAFSSSIKKLADMEVEDLQNRDKMEDLLDDISDDLKAFKAAENKTPGPIPFSALEKAKSEFSERVANCKTIISKLSKVQKAVDDSKVNVSPARLSLFISKANEMLLFVQKNLGDIVNSVDESFKEVALAHSLAHKVAKVAA